MTQNGVWDLVELLEGCKKVGCRWVFKTNRESHGNIEHYKVWLVAKGFTQKDDIDCKETFLPVSMKDSFRIITILVVHYDLKLHQIKVKIVFLNEDVYMDQPVVHINLRNQYMNLRKGAWCPNLRNQYMNLHKLLENRILSSMIIKCTLDLRKIII